MTRSRRRPPLSLRAYAAGLRALATVSPGRADRALVRRFLTPRRRAPEPEVPGLARRRHQLPWRESSLVVWEWGSGPAVLLVHGWEGGAESWRPLIPALVRSGYQVLAPDLPAHGASPGRRTNVLEMARAVERVAEERALHAVVAHSAGAAATALALRAGMEAGRAVMLAPSVRPALHLLDLTEYLGLPLERGLRALEALEVEIGAGLEGANAALAIRDVRVPGLVVHDRDDRRVDPRQGRELAAAWPGCELLLTSGLGHRPMGDPAVGEAIVAFVAASRRATA